MGSWPKEGRRAPHCPTLLTGYGSLYLLNVRTLQSVFVMPSSSARCSQLPRAVDKVPFYVALRKLRDFRRGELPHLDESEVTFPDLELKVEPRKDRLDRQLKQQQEAASIAAHSTLEKKRRLDSDMDFETMFPGICPSAYTCFPTSQTHNGLMPSAGGSTAWNPPAWPPSMPPTLGLQHPSAAAGSSLVQRLSQVPTMDSVFSAVPPLLLKSSNDGAAGLSQYGQFDPCSNRAGSYWPGPSHHYSAGALTNYPYGFQSLYGHSSGAGAPTPSVDGQYPHSKTLPCSSTFPYRDGPSVTSSDIRTLSSAYPANLHAAAAGAYDSSPFFLPSHGMSSGHVAGSAWPASYPYASSRTVSNASYSNPFSRVTPDGE